MTRKIYLGPPDIALLPLPEKLGGGILDCEWQGIKKGEGYRIYGPILTLRPSHKYFYTDLLGYALPGFQRNDDGTGHFLIRSPQDVRNLLLCGHHDFSSEGDVFVKMYPGGEVLFNYTPTAQYRRRWNKFERMSRGLIINRFTGEIVARPFDKFFNYGEEPIEITSEIDYVMEKMDGSLGILYWNQAGEPRVATRGSLTSIQAAMGEEILHNTIKHNKLDRDWTYLFEIIYPENRIVIDYQDETALYLLAARNKETGDYMGIDEIHKVALSTGFKTPRIYPATTVKDVIALKDKFPNREGVVVVFKDGTRVKFKADKYVELHRIVFGLTFKRVLESMQAGTSSQEILAPIPDELYDKVTEWIEEIESAIHQIIVDVDLVFDQAPKGSRKEFALWVQKHHKHLAPYLFAKVDGRPIKSLILKKHDWKEPAE